MSGQYSPTAPGVLSPLAELRTVLLGKVGNGKSQLAKHLGIKEIKEESDHCTLHKTEHAGKRICVVNTPGWDQHSIHNTPENIKEEIIRSVTLCPPGPHAVILVLPVTELSLPSADELETARQHMELLSERVWKHTLVLFLCDREVEQTTVKKHIENAKSLLEKCDNRHHVLNNLGLKAQVQELLEKVNNVVDSCKDFFLPQVYYDLLQSQASQHKDPEEKNKKQEQSEESEGLRHRRNSRELIHPNLTESGEAAKHPNQEESLTLLLYYIKPITMILLTIIGALIGSVAGASYGTLGAVVGIVGGFVLSIPISFGLIYAIKLTRDKTA